MSKKRNKTRKSNKKKTPKRINNAKRVEGLGERHEKFLKYANRRTEETREIIETKEELEYWNNMFEEYYFPKEEGVEEIKKNIDKIHDNFIKLEQLSDEEQQNGQTQKFVMTGTSRMSPPKTQGVMPYMLLPHIHEEISWIFFGSYSVLASYDFLKWSDEIIWNIGSNSHKAPDVIFKGEQTIGVEVTRLKISNMFSKNMGSTFNIYTKKGKLIPPIKKGLEENQFENIDKMIDKKVQLYKKRGWDIECDRKLLVLISNPMGGSEKENAYKAVLQRLADTYNDSLESSPFERVLVA